jgi:peptidoglycan/LPS O-acetylase OafA/YrhL
MNQRLACLDGIRGIAILLVVIGHSFAAFPLFHVIVSRMGVKMFFILSGFLITTLLVRELEKTGAISIERFYWRRTVRIFPAYWVYLTFLALSASLGFHSLLPGELRNAFLYVSNYTECGHVTAHTWSLAVEEQYYLLWPLLFALLGPRSSGLLCVVALVMCPWLRMMHYTDGAIVYFNSFQACADNLAAGCLMALLRERLWQNPRWQVFLRSRCLWMCLPLVAVGIIAPLSYRAMAQTITEMPMLVAMAVLLERSTRFPIVVLTATPLVWLGTVSYSLYLWHMIGMRADQAPDILHFVIAMGLALASYYFVEKPILRWRDRNQSAHSVRVAVAA